MKYKRYYDIQVGDESSLEKPLHYQIAEHFAIRELVVSRFGMNYPGRLSFTPMVLDVGCGSGSGILSFLEFGYDVVGVELNTKKVIKSDWLLDRAKIFEGDIEDIPLEDFGVFDVVWCSHAFEHMRNPEKVLNRLLENTTDIAYFYFILPYPDLTPALAHTASKQLGLNVFDGGKTLVEWFESRGLKLVREKTDSFREPEIWLEFVKESKWLDDTEENEKTENADP